MLKLAAASLNLPYTVVSPAEPASFTADDRRFTGDCLVITWDSADAGAVPAGIPRVNILEAL
jgi:hypothetical protein